MKESETAKNGCKLQEILTPSLWDGAPLHRLAVLATVVISSPVVAFNVWVMEGSLWWLRCWLVALVGSFLWSLPWLMSRLFAFIILGRPLLRLQIEHGVVAASVDLHARVSLPQRCVLRAFLVDYTTTFDSSDYQSTQALAIRRTLLSEEVGRLPGGQVDGRDVQISLPEFALPVGRPRALRDDDVTDKASRLAFELTSDLPAGIAVTFWFGRALD